MHTSAKADLSNVAIRIRVRDPDLHQNLIILHWPNLPENVMQIHLEVFAQSC